MVVPFEFVEAISKCDHLNVILFIMLYKVVLTFESVHEISKCKHSIGLVFIMRFKWFYLFESVDEIRKCDHLVNREKYGAVLPCGTVYYAAQGGSNY